MKIKVNDKTFLFFNNFAVQQSLDTVASTFSLIGRFNPDNPDNKELFKPLSFPLIEIFKDDDTLLLTGRIVNHTFNSKSKPELTKLSGYSLGGVLEDVNIPFSDYPLESINRNLKDIAEKLTAIFGLNLVIDPSAAQDASLIYKKSIASPSESVKSYLSKLTAQRNLILSHNETGDIIILKPDTSTVSKLFFNKENTTNMVLSVRGQTMHSEITVIRQPSKDNDNLTPVDTIQNPFITNVKRPMVKVLTSGTDTDTSKAADNVLGEEIKNIDLKIKISRFEDLKPGDIVDVQNDEVYLFDRIRFMITSLTYNEDQGKQTMSLSLVLPESYTGNITTNIFD